MLIILLILAYGPLNWSFPWWLWALAIASEFNVPKSVKITNWEEQRR